MIAPFNQEDLPHVVIVGGGFCGLYLAKQLGGQPVRVTLIDRRNIHLFQPLLYQVATGGLSPGDIASPLRGVLSEHQNVKVLLGEVEDVDADEQTVTLDKGQTIKYDDIVFAIGAQSFYFGNEDWEEKAPGLKSVEDALEIRRRILLAFEAAERQQHQSGVDDWLTFVIVGGGPTGVEMAGAIGELAHRTLRNNFRNFNPEQTRIILMEGMDQILPSYPEKSTRKAEKYLDKLGVEIMTGCMMTDIQDDHLIYKTSDGASDRINTHTVMWAAGVQPHPMAKLIAERTGAELTKKGQIIVDQYLRVPGHDHFFIGGDLAYVEDKDGKQVPGVAPSAMQMGRYIGDVIKAREKHEVAHPFKYQDKGSLAVIGRFAAVARVGDMQFAGMPAWFLWAFVHIFYLIEFDNRVLVLFQWASDFLTRKRGARFISKQESFMEISS